MKEVPINSRKRPGLFAKVDDDVFPDVSLYTWNILETKSGLRAISTGKHGERVLLHHLVLGLSANSGSLVDFVDGDGFNCQRENLIRRTSVPKIRRMMKRKIRW